MRNYLYLFILLLIFSCGKDIPEEPIPYCLGEHTMPAVNVDSFIPPCIFGPITHYKKRYQYNAPSFNPNNGNQIAYLRLDTDGWAGCNLSLWTFDFCTGEAKYLTDGVCSRVNWSSKDWILFTGTDYQKWKIKSNGEGLTRLTGGGTNTHAAWNTSGEWIVYRSATDTGGVCILMDETGQYLDRFDEVRYASAYDLDENNRLSLFTNSLPYSDPQLALWYLDLDDRSLHNIEYTPVTGFGLKDGVLSTRWWPYKDALLWHTNLYVGYTPLNDGTREILWEGNQNRWYIEMDLSPDEKTIIVERKDRENIDGCNIYIQESLYLLDLETGEERLVVLPE